MGRRQESGQVRFRERLVSIGCIGGETIGQIGRGVVAVCCAVVHSVYTIAAKWPLHSAPLP